MVKIENFYKLGPKFCTNPHFWNGKTKAIRGYGTRLRLSLSYSWTNERYRITPTSVAISTYMVQNLHFLMFSHLLLNFLSYLF